ncbi:hypothetical protein D3C74_476880 [compost metagenome]
MYPGRELEEDELTSRASVPVHELFRKFYQRQTGGAEPEEELVELFMSLVFEGEDEASSEDELAEGGSR